MTLLAQRWYRRHKNNAKNRGIEFKLTFEEWFHIWESSGHLHERGRIRGKYVMARFGDKGPYAVDNIKIILHTDNIQERKFSTETLRQMSLSHVGNKSALGHRHTLETRKRLKKARAGRTPNLGNKGYKLSESTKAKIRKAALVRWAKYHQELSK